MATIVSRKKIIRGTARNDVIVAVGATNNRIYGRGGHDWICAGGGKDIVYGGPGRDRIFGAAGPDRLYGGAANDRIDGGPGFDVCRQATGTGRLARCENTGVAPAPAPIPAPAPAPAPAPTTDFKVRISGPTEGAWAAS